MLAWDKDEIVFEESGFKAFERDTRLKNLLDNKLKKLCKPYMNRNVNEIYRIRLITLNRIPISLGPYIIHFLIRLENWVIFDKQRRVSGGLDGLNQLEFYLVLSS